MKLSTAAVVDVHVTAAENNDDEKKMKRVPWTQEESDKLAPTCGTYPNIAAGSVGNRCI